MAKNSLHLVLLVVVIGIYQSFAVAHPPQKHEPPKPYKFGYDIKDKEGAQYRHEEGDSSGTVRGSYGFVDNKGIHREVHYVADHKGFRAKVITNEPGTAKEDPADVKMQASPPKEHEIPELLKIPSPPHKIRHYQHPIQPEHYQVKQYHHVQPKKYHKVHSKPHHPVLDKDFFNMDHEFPMHKHRNFHYIPRHNFGYDSWDHDFYHDDHFHHYGRHNPPSYLHYSLGGMGSHDW